VTRFRRTRWWEHRTVVYGRLPRRLRQLTWRERVLEVLLPGRRVRRERELERAIRWLVAHPQEPVEFEE
jgi:hypothetical protein